MAKKGFLLRLDWLPRCPAATLTVIANSGCDSWRSSPIAILTGWNPVLIILAERITDILSNANSLFTAAQWKAGLETTISLLTSSTTKVAVIGDNAAYANAASPDSGLSRSLTAVQKSATPLVNLNPIRADRQAAEKSAAVAEHATFISPTPWLCPKTTARPS
jgi:hypothetical protein